MRQYSSKQILDCFIALNRSELRLGDNDRAKPLNDLELQFLMHTANCSCLQVYNCHLFTKPKNNEYLHAISNGVKEIKNGVTNDRATQLANNYEFMCRQEKAHEIIIFSWSFINHLRETESALADF